MQDNKLVKIAYLAMVDLENAGLSYWVSKVHNILRIWILFSQCFITN